MKAARETKHPPPFPIPSTQLSQQIACYIPMQRPTANNQHKIQKKKIPWILYTPSHWQVPAKMASVDNSCQLSPISLRQVNHIGLISDYTQWCIFNQPAPPGVIFSRQSSREEGQLCPPLSTCPIGFFSFLGELWRNWIFIYFFNCRTWNLIKGPTVQDFLL